VNTDHQVEFLGEETLSRLRELDFSKTHWQKIARSISQQTGRILADVSYSAKLVVGVISGFDDLQHHTEGEWEYVEYTTTWTRKWNGEWEGGVSYDLLEQPHYICVRWQNGRHCPLPIVLGDDSEYSMQNAIMQFLHWLAFYVERCKSFGNAFVSCAHYDHQFESHDH